MQRPHQEIDDVVGVARGLDACQVPGPGRGIRVEREEPLLGQRRDKLEGEEGVASGLLVHELGQGPGAVPHAVQGVGDELANIVEGEGRQHDVGHARCGRADGRKRPH